MFGLKAMQRQRNLVYEQTKLLETRAKHARRQAKTTALDMASSPAGLLASFVMGATTQTDMAHKVRRHLLSGASREVLSFLVTQVMTYMAIQPQTTPSEPQKSSASSQDADPQAAPNRDTNTYSAPSSDEPSG